MNGARFVHERLELHGWQVEIADAQKLKGLALAACKTDRIDGWLLAELARRDLLPAIWLPDPRVRAERERARWRLHLVRHRSSLKQRLHAVLLTHGKPCPVSDLFGLRGRQLLAGLGLPSPGKERSRPEPDRVPRGPLFQDVVLGRGDPPLSCRDPGSTPRSCLSAVCGWRSRAAGRSPTPPMIWAFRGRRFASVCARPRPIKV